MAGGRRLLESRNPFPSGLNINTSLPGLTRQSRAACSELEALDARLKAGHDEAI
jgi:hypothetical protein